MKRPGLVAKKILVRAKGGITRRTYWVLPTHGTAAEKTAAAAQQPVPRTTAPASGNAVPSKGKRVGAGVTEYKHKGQRISVWSQNAHESSWRTKKPRQIWYAAIEGKDAVEGMGSKKSAVAAAVGIIERRLIRPPGQ